ncbi:MAG: transposase, partial [Eubacterium sp.]|nr:transposase [Candidatus Colimonas fimequi]
MSKFTPEEKLSAVLRHVDEGISIISIAGSIGAGESTVREWCRNYEAFGAQ